MNRIWLSAGIFVMGLGVGVLGLLAWVTVNMDSAPATVVSQTAPEKSAPAVDGEPQRSRLPGPSGAGTVGSAASTGVDDDPPPDPEPGERVTSGWSRPADTIRPDPRLEPSDEQLRERVRKIMLARDSGD